MREHVGDMWALDADYYCITTNGTLKNNGAGVMGAGCAREAMLMFDGIALRLGANLREYGNHVAFLGGYRFPGDDPTTPPRRELFSFPVKHNWWEKADLELIVRSTHELLRGVEGFDCTVVLPRPGCGNGHLEWEDVKPLIEPLLDDRFIVVTK